MVFNVYQRAMASMERLNQVFDSQPEIVDQDGNGTRPQKVRGAVTFNQLSYRHDGGHARAALSGISCEIRLGSLVALVGPTGSGKSTLLWMIPRLYDAGHGSLMIDGRPVQDYSLTDLRGGDSHGDAGALPLLGYHMGKSDLRKATGHCGGG